MAKKTIKIGEFEVPFKATAATPIYYRELFHREFLRDMQELSKVSKKEQGEDDIPVDLLRVFEDVAYCMAKQAQPSIPEKLEWYDQFDMFSIYEILPHIVELWGINQSPMVNIKKNFP